MLSTQPVYILREALKYLEQQRLVAPGYSFLQDLVGRVVSGERQRLTQLLEQALTPEVRRQLDEVVPALLAVARRFVEVRGKAWRVAELDDPTDLVALPMVPLSWAQSTVDDAKADGLVAEISVFEGAGHVPYAQYKATIIEQTRNFLYSTMDLAHAAR